VVIAGCDAQQRRADLNGKRSGMTMQRYPARAMSGLVKSSVDIRALAAQ
jgi:hypothetical protein